MAVYVVVAKAVGVAEFDDDRVAVPAAEMARGGSEVEVSFCNVFEGLAAFSALDRRLLLVLRLVGVELENCLEHFPTGATLEEKLLLRRGLVRLGAFSLVDFFLLTRPMIIRGVKVLKLCGRSMSSTGLSNPLPLAPAAA